MSKIITVRLDSGLAGLLQCIVDDTERTQSEIIREALRIYLMPLGFERTKRMRRAKEWLNGKPGRRWGA